MPPCFAPASNRADVVHNPKGGRALVAKPLGALHRLVAVPVAPRDGLNFRRLRNDRSASPCSRAGPTRNSAPSSSWRSWPWAGRAVACSPTGSRRWRARKAMPVRPRRSPGWHSAPAPRSITSRWRRWAHARRSFRWPPAAGDVDILIAAEMMEAGARDHARVRHAGPHHAHRLDPTGRWRCRKRWRRGMALRHPKRCARRRNWLPTGWSCSTWTTWRRRTVR